MPITPSSVGSDPPAGPENEAWLATDATSGPVPAGNTAPSGNVGITMAESSAGITTSATFNNGVITRPANGTRSAMAIRITTSGGGSSGGTIGLCRSIGGGSGRGFLIVTGSPTGTQRGTNCTGEIVGDCFGGSAV